LRIIRNIYLFYFKIINTSPLDFYIKEAQIPRRLEDASSYRNFTLDKYIFKLLFCNENYGWLNKESADRKKQAYNYKCVDYAFHNY